MHVSTSASYWDDVGEQFYKKYYGLDKQHKVWADIVMSGRPIEGPLGRFWPIELGRDRKGDLRIPWTILSNYPVQGTSADVMTIARISFWNRIRKLGVPILLVSSVHDSIVVDCSKEYMELVSQTFTEVFRDIPANIKKIFGYTWTVPLACEVKWGVNMKDMEKEKA